MSLFVKEFVETIQNIYQHLGQITAYLAISVSLTALLFGVVGGLVYLYRKISTSV